MPAPPRELPVCMCGFSSLFSPRWGLRGWGVGWGGGALVFAGRGSIATSWPPVWSKVNILREATVQAGTWGGALLVLLPSVGPPPPPLRAVVGRTPPEARLGRGRRCRWDETVSPPGKFLPALQRPGRVLASLKGSGGSEKQTVRCRFISYLHA